MANDKDYVKEAQRTLDPVTDERDADDATLGGTSGIDEGEAADLQNAQTAGSRSERTTEYSGVKHNTEPYGSTQTAGKEQKDTGHAVGITSKKLSEELGADSYVKPAHLKGNEGAFGEDEVKTGDLPKGEAERVETVEVSTETLNK